MSFSEAGIIAAVFALTYLFFVGGKIIQWDLSGFQPENRKQAKCKKMLGQRHPPFSGANLRRGIRKSVEKILLPLGKADKSLLPARMDRTFRQRMERQIDQLARQGLCRDIRLTDVVPLPKNDFTRWDDDGREWREALLQCCALERFLPAAGGSPVREIYRKNACLRVVQSRHIRNADKAEPKGSYYANKARVNCSSCGAVIELNSQQVVCPYCGGVIESDFYDWQTEVFELYEEIGNNLGMALLLLSSAGILFVSIFLCLWLMEDTQISLAAGVGAAVLVVVGIFTLTALGEKRQKQLAGNIVHYSENYLRSCIHEALYREAGSDLLDYSVGTIILKKVTHTAESTTIRTKVCIHEIYLPMGKKPYTKKRKRTLTLQRARYPEKRKADGSFLTERECPSCGANFIPDAHHCCSFCGYGLQTANARWIVQKGRK